MGKAAVLGNKVYEFSQFFLVQQCFNSKKPIINPIKWTVSLDSSSPFANTYSTTKPAFPVKLSIFRFQLSFLCHLASCTEAGLLCQSV